MVASQLPTRFLRMGLRAAPDQRPLGRCFSRGHRAEELSDGFEGPTCSSWVASNGTKIMGIQLERRMRESL